MHEIHIDHINDTHFFTLPQAYEDLLLKMSEKNANGGQLFTPHEVIEGWLHILLIHKSEKRFTIHPCCDTGGFLEVAFEHISRNLILYGVDQPNLWHGNT